MAKVTLSKWVLKAIVQKTISYLPAKNKLNFFFQKYVTKGVFLGDDYFYDRMGHARDHINAYKKYCNGNIPKRTLELGTGWYPVVPMCFFLSGVEEIYTVDISLLTNKERLFTTLKKFADAYGDKSLSTYILVDEDRLKMMFEILQDYERLSFADIIKKLGFKYLIKDARELPLESDSIDLVNSNNTFEHIYPEILLPIVKEFKRVVKKNGEGIFSHFIDMSDHFAHFDKSITIYNFLQFSDKQWNRIDNSIQPQNRMRYSDYLKFYADLKIPVTETIIREGSVEELEKVKLDDKFSSKSRADVAISHCHIISQID